MSRNYATSFATGGRDHKRDDEKTGMTVEQSRGRARVAVVLFNLGGPGTLEEVAPFLFNLFSDLVGARLPRPLQRLVPRIITMLRTPRARRIYAQIGGGSPILKLTRAQAVALEGVLKQTLDARVFVAMRYWRPLSGETARAVLEFAPDDIVLLPLYPQYSTATTASSIADWHTAAARCRLGAITSLICCYPTERSYIAAHARLVRKALVSARRGGGPVKILFSAHGLPRKVIAGGDPYQWQIEQTASAIVDTLEEPGLDWVICYQSRVGPLKWIGPAIGDEIERAGQERKAIVVVPVSFVSEHSETLVELDIQYRELAGKVGVPAYIRVPALGTDDEFINCLADLVRRAREHKGETHGHEAGRICPAGFSRCARTDPCV